LFRCHTPKLAGEPIQNRRQDQPSRTQGKTKEGECSRTLPLYRLCCRVTQAPALAEALSFAPADTFAALVAGT
jgi:hypothetical protein